MLAHLLRFSMAQALTAGRPWSCNTLCHLRLLFHSVKIEHCLAFTSNLSAQVISSSIHVKCLEISHWNMLLCGSSIRIYGPKFKLLQSLTSSCALNVSQPALASCPLVLTLRTTPTFIKSRRRNTIIITPTFVKSQKRMSLARATVLSRF